MIVTIPILLLIFFILSFFVLSDSKIQWFWKTVSISSFCVFIIVFWITISTIMGWGAGQKYIPEIVAIHSVVIREPNDKIKIKGGIFLLINNAESKYNSFLLKVFGYKNELGEPRLFKLEYSRSLHEQLNEILPQLQNGQVVRGKLVKEKIKKNEGNLEQRDGFDSESLEQEWKFYNLKPSYFLRKND